METSQSQSREQVSLDPRYDYLEFHLNRAMSVPVIYAYLRQDWKIILLIFLCAETSARIKEKNY